MVMYFNPIVPPVGIFAKKIMSNVLKNVYISIFIMAFLMVVQLLQIG